MDGGDRDASVLEGLERVTAFFIESFFTWKALDEAHRPPRVRLLPGPAHSYTLLSSLRVIYLAGISHSSIRENKTLTKRDIYYMCPYFFKNPATIDRALKTLSSIVGVHRNDLNIVAAPKGLVVGNVIFVDEASNEINVSMFGINGCLIPARPERMPRVSVSARTIIVIEKEASFHCLLQEEASKEFFRSCVLVTGKGYPDHATRHFLQRLMLDSQTQGKHVCTYLLTDADPHGICIAMTYLSSLPDLNVRWIGVKASDNGKEFQIDSRSQLPLKKSETALMQTLLKRCSDDLVKENKEYSKFWNELSFIKESGVKFEMEALSVPHDSSGISGLLHYLISKICEDEECGNSVPLSR